MNKLTDAEYALKKLVKAVDKWVKAKNIYPVTEKSFKELEKADRDLVSAISTAKTVLEKLIP